MSTAVVRRPLMILGRSTRHFFALIGELTRFFGAVTGAVRAWPRANVALVARQVSTQVLFSGLHAVPLVALLALMVGTVAVIQSFHFLTGIADEYLGELLVTLVVREAGPLATAVIVASRSGTAMTTEIGSMKINREVEALQAFGVDPFILLVVPRLAAATLSLFSLIVLFDVAALGGGLTLAATLGNVHAATYGARVLEALRMSDLAMTALKAVLFGQAIAGIACYYGLQVEKSPTELPQAVTRSVMTTLLALLTADSLLALWMYLA